jgi:hypothetical protein
MKLIAVAFLSLVLTTSCKEKQALVDQQANVEKVNNENQAQESTWLEYEAINRGYFLKITFQNNEIKVFKGSQNADNGTAMKVSKDHLNELNKFIKTYDPENLKNLRGEKKKRMHDGAPHANLTIHKKEESYSTLGFDAGDPPAPIEKVVNIMVSYNQ